MYFIKDPLEIIKQELPSEVSGLSNKWKGQLNHLLASEGLIVILLNTA